MKKRTKPKIGILTDTRTLNLVIESGVDQTKYQLVQLDFDASDLYSRIIEANLSCLFLKTCLKNTNSVESRDDKIEV